MSKITIVGIICIAIAFFGLMAFVTNETIKNNKNISESGKEAYKSGLSIEACPYSPYSQREYYLWRTAWIAEKTKKNP